VVMPLKIRGIATLSSKDDGFCPTRPVSGSRIHANEQYYLALGAYRTQSGGFSTMSIVKIRHFV
ncbi:MAG: hypothetical protein WBH73_08630, partial [Arcanobacterium sp.]